MNEQQWLTSEDPTAMLTFLREGYSGVSFRMGEYPGLTERKLRLFAAAVSRLGCPNGAGDSSLGIAQSWAEAVADDPGLPRPEPYFWWVAHADPREAARQATASGSMSIGIRGPAAVAALLREAFGNPFRFPSLKWADGELCAVTHAHHGMHLALTEYFDPVSWLTPAAIALAEQIDATRDFARLPELAEALEAAGCREQELLMHLRGKERAPGKWEKCRRCGSIFPYIHKYSSCESAGCDEGTPSDSVEKWIDLRGPHVRGCWALDLMLGKE